MDAALVDARDPVALTAALVRCPSVTPDPAGAFDLIEAVLTRSGFRVERPVFGAGDGAVENLFARLGHAAPCFVLAGHVDVVPPGAVAQWTRPPFSGNIESGVLHGRGTVDMKGGVAAGIAAMLRHVDQCGAPPGSLAVLLTADEEGPAVNGTAKLLAWARERGHRLDHCLLPEPTNPGMLGDMIKIGRRGSLSGRLTVRGRQGHVAYPGLARNPIRTLTTLLARLQETALDPGTAHFDPSHLEVTSVDVANTTGNVIPAVAEARFNVRFNESWTGRTLGEHLRALCAIDTPEGISISLAFDAAPAEAFVTEPGPFVALVADAVHTVTGRRPALSTTGGTSDARFIKDYCPVVEFGLVGATMHQIDEHASVADIAALTAIFERVLATYFAAPPSASG